MGRRASYPKHQGPPPPPLPPEIRTVGQVVGESVKFYKENFFPSLLLGVGPALLGLAYAKLHGLVQWFIFPMVVGGLLMTLAFVGATLLVHDLPIRSRSVLWAIVAGWLIYLPVPVLLQMWGLPAVAWLGLFGLAVPAILVERCGLLPGLRRAVRLARADYVHVLGSLATLVMLLLLFGAVLFLLLRTSGESAQSVAAFLGLLVTSPLVLLGAVFVYDDQRARVAAGLSRQQRLHARQEHIRTAPRGPASPGGGRAE
jgi:hypothetical protein